MTPSVSRLLASADDVAALDGVIMTTTPPVVVVVFDQFQLAALLDREGNIDQAAFPTLRRWPTRALASQRDRGWRADARGTACRPDGHAPVARVV